MGRFLELRARRGKDGELKGGAVYRKTMEPFDYHGRRIIVGLEPGDVITFREERCRKTYTLDIKWAFRQAVKQQVDKERAEKRKDKPQRKRVRRGILRRKR